MPVDALYIMLDVLVGHVNIKSLHSSERSA